MSAVRALHELIDHHAGAGNIERVKKLRDAAAQVYHHAASKCGT